MISPAEADRFQSGIMRRLVFLYMMQALVLSVTGMVDCAVVGYEWGAEGLAGMKLAMPVFALLYLFSTILSSGLSVQVTRLLGEGDRKGANQCLMWVCAAAAAISLAVFLAACLFPDPLTRFFVGQANDARIFGHVRGYLLPILFGALPIVMHGILGTVAALEGASRRMAASLAAILVSDILGDFLAVKLNAGIMGIAVASVAAYLCACLVLAGWFVTGKTVFRLERLRRARGMLAAVVVSGLPMAVKSLCEFLCPMAINRIMLRYGSVEGLAALSIQDSAHYLPLAFCEGLAAAVLLLTGIHVAEQDGEALRREQKSIRWYAIGVGSLWALMLMALTPLLVRLFAKDAALRRLGASALLWYLLGVPFVSLNYGVRSYLQGMDRQREASFYTLFNQLLLPVTAAFLLGRFAGVPGIFAAFAIHEIALTACFACWQLFRRKAGAKPCGEENRGEIQGDLRGNLATVRQVTEASDAVIRLCAANGVSPKQAMHVGLCLEELGTNSLQHGYDGKAQVVLEFRFVITGQWLILRLRDNGRPFDLTERYRLLNPEDPASHLGLRLIFASAESVSYSHTFDLNNVCIRSPRTTG